jgi:prenylcysteine oxidase/farnesylcysteine lyase
MVGFARTGTFSFTYSIMRWGQLLVFVSAANAFSLPFSVPFLAANYRSNPPQPAGCHDPSKAVAIIGAGAGGSSAAFFISKAKERYGTDIDVHVYSFFS